MPKKQIAEESDRMPLTKALQELKNKFPWAPLASLRKSVSQKRIPSIRSSDANKARYYVRLSDLEKAILEHETETT